MFQTYRLALALAGVFLMMMVPVKAAPHARYADPNTVVLTVDGRGHHFLDGSLISEGHIGPLLAARVHQHPHLTARIRADRTAAYGQVKLLIDLVKQSGIRNVALATLKNLPR